MVLEFTLDNNPKQKVIYKYDKFFSGRVTIDVNGKRILETKPTIVKKSQRKVHETIKFRIGEDDSLDVEIDAFARVPILSAFFPYEYEVRVDGEKVLGIR